MKKKTKILILLLVILLFLAAIPLTLNGIVLISSKNKIRKISPADGYETAMILGAKVHQGGRLSDMLRDRMDAGIELYHAGAVSKLLVSGDGRGEWSETAHMKAYAMEKGVREEDILTDGEGFSTYESVIRAKSEFGLEKFVVVTQKYHLYRAIYIADDLGLTVLGADASLHRYAGQSYREAREILARCKDLVVCLLH